MREEAARMGKREGQRGRDERALHPPPLPAMRQRREAVWALTRLKIGETIEGAELQWTS